MAEQPEVSFELNEEMLDLIADEFDIRRLVDRFCRTVSGKGKDAAEAAAEEIFSLHGSDWMKRTLQLGEEYSDRTFEVLKEAIDSTGGHLRFPLLPQRFLEIAYLATHGMALLPVYENSPKRLVYRIDDCAMFETIKATCGGDMAEIMPCRHSCLSACKTLFVNLNYPEADIRMQASTSRDGYCKFVITRGQIREKP
jgi:hypothetical protein